MLASYWDLQGCAGFGIPMPGTELCPGRNDRGTFGTFLWVPPVPMPTSPECQHPPGTNIPWVSSFLGANISWVATSPGYKYHPDTKIHQVPTSFGYLHHPGYQHPPCTNVFEYQHPLGTSILRVPGLSGFQDSLGSRILRVPGFSGLQDSPGTRILWVPGLSGFQDFMGTGWVLCDAQCHERFYFPFPTFSVTS